MPIDPSIPLQIQPANFMTPAQMMSLKDVALQYQSRQLAVQEQERQVRTRGELEKIYMGEGAIDKTTGLPTPETVAKVTAIDPAAGVQQAKALADFETKRAAAKAHVATYDDKQLDMYRKKLGIVDEGMSGALAVYDGEIKSGRPPAQATARAQEYLSGKIDEAKKSGLFSTEEISRINPSFDEKRVRAAMQGTLTYKQILDEEHEGRREKATSDRDAETRRYHRAREGTEKIPSGYEKDPDNPGAMRPVKGGPADQPKRDKYQADALAEYRANYPMGPVKPGDPTAAQYVDKYVKQKLEGVTTPKMGKYKNANEVKAAYQAGTIKKDEARRIIESDFPNEVK